MSESLACLLVAVALLVALDLHDDPTPRRADRARRRSSVSACLTRSELGLLAVGFAVLAWWRPRRRWCPPCILAASAVTVAPWVVYNLTQFDRTVLLSTNDGTTLLGANCDRTYYDDLGGWDIRCLEPVPTDDTVDASVRSAQRRDVAVDYVQDHLDPGPGGRDGPGRSFARRLRAVVARRPRPRRGEGRLGGVGGDRVLVDPRRRRRSPAGGCSGGTPTEPIRSLARGLARLTQPASDGGSPCRCLRCSSRPSCSTAPTASGPPPSRPSCCWPRSDSSPAGVAFGSGRDTLDRRDHVGRQARRPARRAARARAGGRGVQRRRRFGVPRRSRHADARAGRRARRHRRVAVARRRRARRLPGAGRRVGTALDARRDDRDGARRLPHQRHGPLLPLQGRADGRRRADRRR